MSGVRSGQSFSFLLPFETAAANAKHDASKHLLQFVCGSILKISNTILVVSDMTKLDKLTTGVVHWVARVMDAEVQQPYYKISS